MSSIISQPTHMNIAFFLSESVEVKAVIRATKFRPECPRTEMDSTVQRYFMLILFGSRQCGAMIPRQPFQSGLDPMAGQLQVHGFTREILNSSSTLFPGAPYPR